MTTSHDQCYETILQIISLCLVQNSCMNKRAIKVEGLGRLHGARDAEGP